MNLKKHITVSIFITFFIAILATSVNAEEKPQFTGSITPTSKYVFRGYELSKDSLCIFLDGAVSYKGFSAGIWADLDTDYYGTEDEDEQGNMELYETDFILSYSNNFKKFNYTLGYIYYDYEEMATGENQEVYASLGLDSFLSPTITCYREIEIGTAYYTTLDLSHSYPLANGYSVDGGVKVSYLYDQDGDPDGSSYSAFHDGVIWAGLSIPLGKYFNLSPKIHYSFPLESDSEDNIEAASFDGDDSDFVWGSLQLSMKF